MSIYNVGASETLMRNDGRDTDWASSYFRFLSHQVLLMISQGCQDL